MLFFNTSQRKMMAKAVDARHTMDLTDIIYRELCEQAMGVLKPYDKDGSCAIIADVVNKCFEREVRDENQILNLCYIRLAIDMDVFTSKAFSYVLDNGLMPPYAKARHLILSFFAINAMRMVT